MLLSYNDITSRINESPKWYTPEGYPRYCEFTPQETGIYAKFALLVEIQCQSCHKSFMVGEGYTRENQLALQTNDAEHFFNDLNKIIKYYHYHYGNPPSHDCVGDTMNCDDIRFVEVWEHQLVTWPWQWIRRTDLEAPCEYWVNDSYDEE